MYFGALSRYRKGWVISFKKLADQFILLFDQAKNKKVDEHIDIQQQFQNSTTCPNDMIHTLVTSMFPDFIMRATAMLKTPLGTPMGLSMTLTNLIRKMKIIWRQCVGGTTIFWSNVGKSDGGEGQFQFFWYNRADQSFECQIFYVVYFQSTFYKLIKGQLYFTAIQIVGRDWHFKSLWLRNNAGS